MRALQKELDDLRRDKERDSRRAREDGEELAMLRERCERLENKRAPSGLKWVRMLSIIHHSIVSILIVPF
jgi:hypothetical protein